MKFDENRVLETINSSDKAVTYGEILADMLDEDVFMTSLGTNLYCLSREENNINVLFKEQIPKIREISKFYILEFYPGMQKMIPKKIKYQRRKGVSRKKTTHSRFVSNDMKKIEKRFEEELERKRKIMPELLSITKQVGKIISENNDEEGIAFLRGSSSILNDSPFIYYGNRNELRAASDIDIEYLTTYNDSFGELIETVRSGSAKEILDEIIERKKVAINYYIKDIKRADDELFFNGVRV